MPYTKSNPPDRIKKLPKGAQSIWISAFNSALKEYDSEETANKVAWSAVKKKYKKEGDKWIKKNASELEKFAFFSIKANKLEFKEENGKTKSVIQVLPVGEWEHPLYGEIQISEKEVEGFVENFKKGIRKDIPITEGHAGGEEKPAIGWFKELINKGRDGLWAVVEWTKKGSQLLKSDAYKYFSPEFYSTYEDPQTHEEYENVLVGGALTNFPYFKELATVMLSELTIKNNKTMTLKEIAEKKASELDEQEKDYLRDHAGELTDEQKEKFEEVLKDKGEEAEEEAEEEEAEEEEEEPVEGSEVVSKKALRILQKKAQRGDRAMREVEKMKAIKFVDKLTFDEKTKEGVLLGKSRDKVVDFYLTLSEKQRKEFEGILEEIPSSKKLFSELGDDGDDDSPKGAEKKFDDLVRKELAEAKKQGLTMSYRDAMEKVIADNPNLADKIEA